MAVVKYISSGLIVVTFAIHASQITNFSSGQLKFERGPNEAREKRLRNGGGDEKCPTTKDHPNKRHEI